VSEDDELDAAVVAVDKALAQHFPDLLVTDWVLIAAAVGTGPDARPDGRTYTHLVSDGISAHASVGLARILCQIMEDSAGRPD